MEKITKSDFIEHLKKAYTIKRWALKFSFDEENDAEHSLIVGAMAHIIATIGVNQCEKTYDPAKIAMSGILHEAGEWGGGGDIVSPAKYCDEDVTKAMKEMENNFEWNLVNNLPDDLKDVYEGFLVQDSVSKEIKQIVKAADDVAALLKASMEVDLNNKGYDWAEWRLQQQVIKHAKLHEEVGIFIDTFCEPTLLLDRYTVHGKLFNSVKRSFCSFTRKGKKSIFLDHFFVAPKIKRWSMMFSFAEENVAEHSFTVSSIAHIIANIGIIRYGRDYDANTIGTEGIFHQAASWGGGGDIVSPAKNLNPTVKKAINYMELSFEKAMVKTMPRELQDTYKEFFIREREHPSNKAILKAAIDISMYIKAYEEVNLGNLHYLAICEKLRKTVDKHCETHEEVRDFVQTFCNENFRTVDEMFERRAS